MLTDLAKRVKDWQKRTSWSFGDDISTPKARRQAHLHRHLVDHAFLRTIWTNLAEIAPGVWRSNQPSPARIAFYAELGIRSIIYLRGPARWSYLLLEEEACAAHGLTLHIAHLNARSLAPRERVLELLDLFDRVETPVLMHCKSGADRAGLASALWLLHREGASVDRARQELSLRYMHVKNSGYGVLDHMLDRYEADRGDTALSIRDWVTTDYDNVALTHEWRDIRATKAAR